VAADEELERPFVAVRDELFQQLSIADVGAFAPARDRAEVTDHALKLTGRHGISPAP
jgi:hypothetical protein